MKRVLKVILPFVLIAAAFVVYHSSLRTPELYGDTRGHWAEAKIEKWSGYGVITGSNGAFRPADGVTRAEMCTIISRVAELPEAAEDIYSDVNDEWYAEVMLRCAAAGVLQAEDGRLFPEEKLSRAQALDMLLKALGAEDERGLELLCSHYRNDAAANNFGYDDDFQVDETFRQLKEGFLDPETPLSRAELVLMLDACQAEGYLVIE